MTGPGASALKNLLITGRPGSGKTTLIERLLQSFTAGAGGFLTREIRERGVRRGFRIETLDGESDVLASDRVHGPVRVGKVATIQLRSDAFADHIKARPEVRVFEIDPSNRDAVRAAIGKML